jgi:hypothetical protein
MNLLRSIGLWAVMLAAAAARLPAQTTAAELLQRAIHQYEEVEIEDALTMLRQIVAPSSTLAVSPEERAQAYKYMGAVFAMQPGTDKHDSAVAYFSAAIAQDPAVDLDAQSFTPAQLAVFSEARNRTFVVAVRPLRQDTLEYGVTMLIFRCLTSHAALLRAELRTGGATALVLYDGPSNGLRQMPWDGTLPGRALPVPGRYEMVLTGHSSMVDRADSAAVYFDLGLDHPPLDDTLPDLGPQELRPEVGVPSAQIPANVAENQRRRAERASANAAVAGRNAEALRRARLVIVPAATRGP